MFRTIYQALRLMLQILSFGTASAAAFAAIATQQLSLSINILCCCVLPDVLMLLSSKLSAYDRLAY